MEVTVAARTRCGAVEKHRIMFYVMNRIQPMGSPLGAGSLSASVFAQVRCRILHPRNIRVGRTRKAGTVVGIGLIEVREHGVLVRVVGDAAKVTRQRRDEVGLPSFRQRPVLLAGLTAVEHLMDLSFLRRSR